MGIDDDILGIGGVVHLDELDKAMRRLRLAGADLAPVFRQSRRELRADIRDHAKAQESSEGKWPPLSPWTIAKRQARHGFGRKGGDKGYQGRARRAHKIGPVQVKGRRMLGRLPGAFDIIVERNRIVARSRVPWSGAHKDGATVGKGSRLPARDWLWASKQLLEQIVRRTVNHLYKAWGR